jgi:hypothetical protein
MSKVWRVKVRYTNTEQSFVLCYSQVSRTPLRYLKFITVEFYVVLFIIQFIYNIDRFVKSK